MARPHSVLIDIAAERVPSISVTDEAALLRSAADHRMTGLLWEACERGDVTLSHETKQQLALSQLLVGARHATLLQALQPLAEATQALGVEWALAKGLAADAQWYGKRHIRPSRDLDVVVDPSSLSRFGALARLLDPAHRGIRHLDDMIADNWLQSIDIRITTDVWLDLHADLLKLDVASRGRQIIWDRMQPVSLADGRTVRTLDAECAMVHFLLHLNKDRFSHLIHLADIVRILRQEDLDWDFIDEFLDLEGFRPHALLSLAVVQEELDVELPVPRPSRGWRAAIWRRLWPAEVRLRGDVGWLEHHRRQFTMPFISTRPRLEAFGPWRRRVLPPRPLLDYFHAGTSGPYVTRLVRSRIHGERSHRRQLAQIAQRYKPT